MHTAIVKTMDLVFILSPVWEVIGCDCVRRRKSSRAVGVVQWRRCSGSYPVGSTSAISGIAGTSIAFDKLTILHHYPRHPCPENPRQTGAESFLAYKPC